MTEPLDILAIGAHPDDVEVGCGGVLIQAADAGLRVGAADLTRGEHGTLGTFEERAAERERATELMGLTTRVQLELPDGAVGTLVGHRDEVVALIRDTRPAVVLAPYTEDRHPDHAAAGRLARDASFLAGVRKLGGGRAHRPERVYHYMVHLPFAPSFVVDISAVWNRKWAAMAAYESQFEGDPSTPGTDLAGGSFLALLEARASFHGAMIGADRGEPFFTVGPVSLPFLPGFQDIGPPAATGYRMFF
jgi:bacillithiol biosynthesis deacetylase BshB1